MTKNIIVPLDGSGSAFKALEFACDLADKHGANLLLLHVVPSRELPESVRQFAEVEHLEGPPEWVYEKVVAQNVIGSAIQQARNRGIQASKGVVMHGDPAKTIVEVADSENADMIVMGTRGLSDIQGLVMGSVAHKVSHMAGCTVVTVK